MLKWVPRSLQGLLLTHETALLLLIVITGVLAGVWAYFWQQSSRESVRINSLSYQTQQIRGDLYRQLKEVNRARLLEEPAALEYYRDYSVRIDQHFVTLAALIDTPGEQTALDYLGQTYRKVRQDMDKIFADPYVIGDAARMKILDPLYEEWMLAEFESALLIFDEILAVHQRDLEASLAYWTGLAPVLITIPVVSAVCLLFLSRRSLRRDFVRPMQQLVSGARQFSRGELEQRIAEQGVAEVRELAEAFNTMAKELETSRDALVVSERQAALGALVPVVAHNIRNPLASIRAAAQILDEPDDPEELAEIRAEIINTVDRLERWVTALLSYLHPLQLHRRSVPLAELVDGAVALLQTKVRQKEITLQREQWNPAWRVLVDVDLLEQAIYGLLNNAVDASPLAGSITLALTVAGDAMVLSISDEGPGIPFNPQPSSLSPGPSTKRFGTGLGIPFAFKVAQAHGGIVCFDRPNQGGTRVTLWLPLS